MILPERGWLSPGGDLAQLNLSGIAWPKSHMVRGRPSVAQTTFPLLSNSYLPFGSLLRYPFLQEAFPAFPEPLSHESCFHMAYSMSIFPLDISFKRVRTILSPLHPLCPALACSEGVMAQRWPTSDTAPDGGVPAGNASVFQEPTPNLVPTCTVLCSVQRTLALNVLILHHVTKESIKTSF